ncbi:MAG: adenylate/guanylate cyclase domain-containing protein, partial [Gammaproteobacteria bacterium]
MVFGIKKIPRELLFRRHIVPAIMGLAITMVMAWAGIYEIDQVPLLRTMEYASYDIRLRQSLTHQADSRVVILDIDEKSLAEEGRFPWPRQKMARLVENLGDAGAAVIAFDIVFAEPEERSDRRLLNDLLEGPLKNNGEFAATARRKIDDLDGDAHFARALAKQPVVMGYFFDAATGAENVGYLPNNGADASRYLEAGIQFGVVADSYGANLKKLQDAATTGGFFNTRLDPDGVLRRVPLFTQYGNDIYPLLSLEAVRLYLGEPGWQLATDTLLGEKTIDYVVLGEHRINTDHLAQMLIPYRGGARTFTYISATDILSGNYEPDSLRDKIVFVGTSAKGLLDLRPTPITTIYPGVEVHATVVDGILNGDVRAETLEKAGIDPVLLVGFGILLSIALTILQPLWAIIAALAASAVVIAINLSAWSAGIVLALATPLITIALLLVTNLAYGFLFESRDRRQLQSMFGQYVPPELVDEMSQNPDSFNLDGESRLMTVLFADIRGFTSISETVSPRELKDLLNRYFTPMTRIIHEQRGTIDKYVGDMIMAFWGAPLDDPDHARHGVYAAMKMIDKTHEMKAE